MAGSSLFGRQVGWSVACQGRVGCEWDQTTNLVHVMMNMLASNDGSNGVALLLPHLLSRLELGTLLLETSFDCVRIAVHMLTMLDRDDVVLVLLGKNLAVFYWLHGRMVVVLMNLTIDGSGSLFVLVFRDVLVDNGGGDLLVDCGVIVTSLAPTESAMSVYMSRSLATKQTGGERRTHWESRSATNASREEESEG